MNIIKICKKCNQYKKLDEFYNNKITPDKKDYICKMCSSLRLKEYYKQNRERLISNVKKYSEEHKEEKLAYIKQYQKENPECAKNAMKRFLDKNPNYFIEKYMEYYNNDPNFKEYTSVISENRSRLNVSKFTKKDIIKLSEKTAEFKLMYDYQHENCTYCNKKFNNKHNDQLTIDHIEPYKINKNNSIDNLTFCCMQCNRNKRDLSLFEFCKKYNFNYKEIFNKIKKKNKYIKDNIIKLRENICI